MIDLNDRSPGYEPDEITWLLQPAGTSWLLPLFQGLRGHGRLFESRLERPSDDEWFAHPECDDGAT